MQSEIAATAAGRAQVRSSAAGFFVERKGESRRPPFRLTPRCCALSLAASPRGCWQVNTVGCSAGRLEQIFSLWLGGWVVGTIQRDELQQMLAAVSMRLGQLEDPSRSIDEVLPALSMYFHASMAAREDELLDKPEFVAVMMELTSMFSLEAFELCCDHVEAVLVATAAETAAAEVVEAAETAAAEVAEAEATVTSPTVAGQEGTVLGPAAATEPAGPAAPSAFKHRSPTVRPSPPSRVSAAAMLQALAAPIVLSSVD